jgi:hypothetical protein
MRPPALLPQPFPGLHRVRLDDELVLWHPRGDLHHLDRAATAVFDLLDVELTVSGVVTRLAETTGAPAAAIERDVLALLEQLARQLLVIDSQDISDNPPGQRDVSDQAES